LSNGDIWSATISYDGSNLSLSVKDPSEPATDVIYNNLPIDISSFLGTNDAFVGFTAGTGSGAENQDILNWQFANDTSLGASTPEPASLALFGSALPLFAMLYYLKKRRTPALQTE
jgi:hypothetical protein